MKLFSFILWPQSSQIQFQTEKTLPFRRVLGFVEWNLPKAFGQHVSFDAVS